MGHTRLRELSAFFPLYNEEKNVSPLVEEALDVIPKLADKYEILLINDGSTDRTQEVADTIAAQYENVRVISQRNRGYGGALKTGFSECRYEWIFFSDGDRQFRLEELKNFLWHVPKNDLIIGYRLTRAEGFLRKIITLGLRVWNKLLYNFPLYIKDIDCAFKLMKKKVVDDVSPLLSDGGMISTEFLLKAIRKGCRIKQVPVKHHNREFGKSTGDSMAVIKKAVVESFRLLKDLPEERGRLQVVLFTVILFLALFPLANSINFMQNDDYTHYRLVESFMEGNYTLDPYIGATFYLQGFIGMIFASFFGLAKVSVLTLLVSILSLYVFLKILMEFLDTSAGVAILLGLLFLFNPFFLYSMWGFMSENYFMLFFLLSLYFIFSFISHKRTANFISANLFIVLSYFIRQFAFVTSLAFALYLLLKRQYRFAVIQLLLFFGLLAFHYLVFPVTPQMYDASLKISTILDVERTYSLLFVVGIYLSLFTLPLIVNGFLKPEIISSRLKTLSLLLVIPLVFFLIQSFNPKSIDFSARLRSGKVYTQFAKVEFPYLENVFGRKGFLEKNLDGNKYHYPGFFDLFNYLDVIGKVGVALALVLLLYNYRYVFSFSFIYIVCFGALLVIAPRIFDRYLLPLVPVAIILITAMIGRLHYLQKLILLGYVVFLFILGYEYTADLIAVNGYVWNRAEKLHAELDVSREQINVNHSWRSLYPVEGRNWIYYFEYAESKRLNSDKFEVMETKKIEFPFNIYIDPEVYIFKRIAEFDN